MFDTKIKDIAEYIDVINKKFGLSVEFKYRFEDEGKVPLRKNDDTFVIVPEFFYHEELTDAHRKMLITFVYAAMYLSAKYEVSPFPAELVAKGFCEALGEKYIPIYKIEEIFREIRSSIYEDINERSYFSIGDVVRIDVFSRYRVTGIRIEKDKIYIAAEPYGHKATVTSEEKVFEESELYKLHNKETDFSDVAIDLKTVLEE